MGSSSRTNAVDCGLIDRFESRDLCGEHHVGINLCHTDADSPCSLYLRTFDDGSRGRVIGAGVIAINFIVYVWFI